MGVAATWGEWGAVPWIWALYTGYVFFVFGFGGMAWKKVLAWLFAAWGPRARGGLPHAGSPTCTCRGSR